MIAAQNRFHLTDNFAVIDLLAQMLVLQRDRDCDDEFDRHVI